MRKQLLIPFVLMLFVGAPHMARAHFLWLVLEPQGKPTTVKVYFGEQALPDDPDLLDRVTGAEAFVLSGRRDAEPKQLELKKGTDGLEAELPKESRNATVILRDDYGVISRGGEPFALKYYAKVYPSSLPGTWQAVNDTERLPLEVTPELDGSSLLLKVTFGGKPAAGATVTIGGPGLSEDLEGTADDKGVFRCNVTESGRFSIRARHIEETAGESEGKAYSQIRHYSTLTLDYAQPQLSPIAHKFPELPQGVTSFGGAVAGDWLYVYGGHYGAAHHYSQEGQSGDFYRLNLKQPGQWEALPGGPKRTGLAMVAHNGRIYRIGGFEARNAEAQDQSLWSMADFARFDPSKGAWEDLPALPEGRSSLDAAVIGDTLYVVGGWTLKGDEESVWHDTAWAVDLSSDKLEWRAIPNPPFRRRALTIAEWNGKLVALGGMQEQGGPTTAVAIFDPAKNEWSEGPALLGTGMDGFGASAFACGKDLYATTMSGAIQRLDASGKQWEFVGQLTHPRFFHRMLPWQQDQLVVVGGASMGTGKITELELLKPSTPVQAAARE